MASHAIAGHDDGHAHTHHTTTGLDHRKIAIWAFIGSECMLLIREAKSMHSDPMNAQMAIFR